VNPRKNSSYRIASIAVIGTFMLVVLSSFLPIPQQAKEVSASPDAENIGWDPCTTWVSYGYMHNLAVLVSFGACLFFAVQGLRGHSGPRWLALAGLFSLVLVVEDIWWQIGCGGTARTVLSCMAYSATAAMFLYHAVYPARGSGLWPPGHRKVAVLYRGVVLSFMSILSFWLCICHLSMLAPAQKREFAASIVSDLQRNISLPAHLLFLCAVGLTVYRRMARSGSATRESG
jgi:hypothetical protein